MGISNEEDEPTVLNADEENGSAGQEEEEIQSELERADQDMKSPPDEGLVSIAGKDSDESADDDRYPESHREDDEAEEDFGEDEELEEPDLGDALIEKIAERAKAPSDKLRNHLSGTVLLQVQDTKGQYIFDWSGSEVSVTPAKTEDADCLIKVSEKILSLVSRGRLNPQIGMLSNKIEVTGDSSLAVFFFNLVVPQGRGGR